jgi:ADP-L-glycero-D-manno-heptose 6-epimerase
MYIVTGGAGFIGSNIVERLNASGIDDILVVDDMTASAKFTNLAEATISDFMDRGEFRERLESDRLSLQVEAIFHQGACTDTMEYDGRYMMENNFTYSKVVLRYALAKSVPFVYASSGAVYGSARVCREEPEYESPLNIYGYSKLAFDQYVRKVLPNAKSTVVGLRYFNVYGPGEAHKGRMASTIFQFHRQLRDTGLIRLFGASHGYANGAQSRDFVYIDDVVDVNLHFLEQPLVTGIFNLGTGKARPFNDVARLLLKLHGSGKVEYIPFPQELLDKYQAHTQADLTRLQEEGGYEKPFTALGEGIRRYWEYLKSRD